MKLSRCNKRKFRTAGDHLLQPSSLNTVREVRGHQDISERPGADSPQKLFKACFSYEHLLLQGALRPYRWKSDPLTTRLRKKSESFSRDTRHFPFQNKVRRRSSLPTILMARRRAEREANVKNESGVKSELSLKRERDEEHDGLMASASARRARTRPFTNGEVVELD